MPVDEFEEIFGFFGYTDAEPTSTDSDDPVDEFEDNFGFGACEEEPSTSEPTCHGGCSSCDECRPDANRPFFRAERVLGPRDPVVSRTLSFLTRPVFEEVHVDVVNLEELRETNDDVVRIDGVRQKRK